MADYVLKGGQYVKYDQTFLPDCRCDNVPTANKRQLGQALRKRATQQTCIGKYKQRNRSYFLTLSLLKIRSRVVVERV